MSINFTFKQKRMRQLEGQLIKTENQKNLTDHHICQFSSLQALI